MRGQSREDQIEDAAVEARIEKQLQATGSSTVEEVLLHLLETQEEQDRWLLENREALTRKSVAAWTSSTMAKESPKSNWMPT
jgi:hypothetical protein